MISNRQIPLKKPYFFTLILLIIAGILLSIALSIAKGSAEVFLMGIGGTAIATVLCTLLNLLYFLPTDSLALKLISPGAASAILFLILFRSSQTDLLFFSFFGIINLLIGIYWYSSINKIKREENQ